MNYNNTVPKAAPDEEKEIIRTDEDVEEFDGNEMAKKSKEPWKWKPEGNKEQQGEGSSEGSGGDGKGSRRGSMGMFQCGLCSTRFENPFHLIEHVEKGEHCFESDEEMVKDEPLEVQEEEWVGVPEEVRDALSVTVERVVKEEQATKEVTIAYSSVIVAPLRSSMALMGSRTNDGGFSRTPVISRTGSPAVRTFEGTRLPPVSIPMEEETTSGGRSYFRFEQPELILAGSPASSYEHGTEWEENEPQNLVTSRVPVVTAGPSSSYVSPRVSHLEKSPDINIGYSSYESPAQDSSSVFRCSSCPETFNSTERLKAHKRSKHAWECPHCPDIFFIKPSLDRHIREKHQPSTVTSFASDVLIEATSEGFYSCKVCGKTVAARSDMSKHVRRHTDERPFSCTICSERFKHRSAITNHMRIHTGEKPYTCTYCGKNFSQPSNKRRHEALHRGERPYTCSLCQRSFSEKTTLQTHMLQHTGERPFKCDVCGKGHITNSALNQHKKSRHPDQSTQEQTHHRQHSVEEGDGSRSGGQRDTD